MESELYILVLAHRRPRSLWNVLESLRRQGALPFAHVWIDGHSHTDERAEKVQQCRQLAVSFPEAQWISCNGRLGIARMMLDGLGAAARQSRNIIVLEDDCFPTADAVETFRRSLADIDRDPGIYSVYGHYFRVPGEGERFTRFQGWGWATTREKLLPILTRLRELLLMSEPDYIAWTSSVLTPQIRARLDVTPGRNVIDVLGHQFSWDSATTLLTALRGLEHSKTPKQVVFNSGMGPDSGHFHGGQPWLRDPPFNIIGEDEVWQYFNEPLPEPYRGRTYFGRDELDRKLAAYLPPEPGFFVELGAHDGLSQSNTLYFERRGWRGVLVEAVEEFAAACRKNRPLAHVVHAACVAPDFIGPEVDLHAVGLMSLVVGARAGRGDEEAWLTRAEAVQKLTRSRRRAPAQTLTNVLAEAALERIDLLSLDVEGYEIEVLKGLDFSRFTPTQILVEESGEGEIKDFLFQRGYRVVDVLDEHTYTRDVLYRLSA